jgi:hypothetical protein
MVGRKRFSVAMSKSFSKANTTICLGVYSRRSSRSLAKMLLFLYIRCLGGGAEDDPCESGRQELRRAPLGELLTTEEAARRGANIMVR